MKQLTQQQIFTKVARHLLTQMEKSDNGQPKPLHRCEYHSEKGLRCAIGVLIPWSIDTSEFNEDPVELIPLKVQRKCGFDVTRNGEQSALLDTLQNVHDNFRPIVWAKRLREVAKGYGLKMPKITKRKVIK